MTLLIIITALLLIISILLEPSLSRFIDRLKTPKPEEKQDAPIQKQEMQETILGKSTYQFLPSKQDDTSTLHKAASGLEAEKPTEKDSTFALSNEKKTQEEQEFPDEGIPLEREKAIDPDEEAEEIKEVLGPNAEVASGMGFHQLGELKKIIQEEQSDISQQKKAGKILYENKATDMVEQLVNHPLTTARISSLIDLHLLDYTKENPKEVQPKNLENQQDIDNWNIGDFIQ